MNSKNNMSRKEFLLKIWNNGLKPLLFLFVLIFCLKFLIKVFSENGTERFITILVISFVFLSTSTYFIGTVFKNILSKTYSKMSENLKFVLTVFKRFLNFLFPIALGFIIFIFWQRDWKSVSFLFGIIAFLKVIEIIKDEKHILSNGHSGYSSL
jgi:hypothetical protein